MTFLQGCHPEPGELYEAGLAGLVGSAAPTCTSKASVLVRVSERVNNGCSFTLDTWSALRPCPTCSSFQVWVQDPLGPGSPWKQECESLQRWPGRGLSRGRNPSPGLDFSGGALRLPSGVPLFTELLAQAHLCWQPAQYPEPPSGCGAGRGG